MFRTIALMVMIVAFVTVSAAAEEILLHSVSRADNLAGTCYADSSSAVYFSIGWAAESDWIPPQPSIGNSSIKWHDGETGYFDFTAENTNNFNVIALGITNGEDNYIYFFASVINGPGAYSGRLESVWNFGDPDLAGYNITRIRLVAEEINLIECDTRVKWEFWGEGRTSSTEETTWGVMKSLYR